MNVLNLCCHFQQQTIAEIKNECRPYTKVRPGGSARGKGGASGWRMFKLAFDDIIQFITLHEYSNFFDRLSGSKRTPRPLSPMSVMSFCYGFFFTLQPSVTASILLC